MPRNITPDAPLVANNASQLKKNREMLSKNMHGVVKKCTRLSLQHEMPMMVLMMDPKTSKWIGVSSVENTVEFLNDALKNSCDLFTPNDYQYLKSRSKLPLPPVTFDDSTYNVNLANSHKKYGFIAGEGESENSFIERKTNHELRKQGIVVQKPKTKKVGKQKLNARKNTNKNERRGRPKKIIKSVEIDLNASLKNGSAITSKSTTFTEKEIDETTGEIIGRKTRTIIDNFTRYNVVKPDLSACFTSNKKIVSDKPIIETKTFNFDPKNPIAVPELMNYFGVESDGNMFNMFETINIGNSDFDNMNILPIHQCEDNTV